MDALEFDTLVKTLGTGVTRRAALAAAAGAAGVGAWPPAPSAAAKGKKHKRQRCRKSDAFCAQDGSGKPCCSGLCCPPWVFADQTKYACAPAGEVSGCCTVEQGGGYCSGFPLCCGDPSRERETICEQAGGECCTDEWGGSCDPGFACCADAAFGYCCPKAARSADSTLHDALLRQKSRNFRRRDDLPA